MRLVLVQVPIIGGRGQLRPLREISRPSLALTDVARPDVLAELENLDGDLLAILEDIVVGASVYAGDKRLVDGDDSLTNRDGRDGVRVVRDDVVLGNLGEEGLEGVCT